MILAPPDPSQVLGYPMGGRLTDFRRLEQVHRALVAAEPTRVREIVYGQSVQGRPLRVFAISTPENIARLDDIRAANARRARGETVTDGPAIVWVNEGIHGNEPASVESGMWLMKSLLDPGDTIQASLKDVVVILNPTYNPDGRERFVTFTNSVGRGDAARGMYEEGEPSAVAGRSNHFRFDLNRDRVAFSQDETRAEFAEALRWNPQVYIDQHGQTEPYFFPPEPQSINVNVDRERNLKWTQIFGRAIARDFEARKFPYFVGETFDLYYPGYVDSSTTLTGAIGMTHETDGARTVRGLRDDGTLWTLASAADKHLTSALAVIRTAADNRSRLLSDFTTFKRRVTGGEASGAFRRVIMTGDPRELRRLQSQLSFAGIESRFVGRYEQPDARDYAQGPGATKTKTTIPSGSLVVDLAQPQGAFAKALLEPGQNFEKSFIERQIKRTSGAPAGEEYPGNEGGEFYDITGWSLPYAYGVRAWWSDATPATPTPLLDARYRPDLPVASAGYALTYRDRDDALLVLRALADGLKVSVVTQPVRAGRADLAPGTFVFLASRNDESLRAKLSELAHAFGGDVTPLTSTFPEGIDGSGAFLSLGSGSVRALRGGKIGMVFGETGQLGDVGGAWWTLERDWNVPFVALKSSALGDADILREYGVLLVPSGARVRLTDELKTWVARGGRLVVLDGESWALAPGFAQLGSAVSAASLPGSLFRARLDRRVPATYGYAGEEIAVPVGGGPYFAGDPEGGSAVRLAPEAKGLLLSGWAWPNETEEKLKGLVWLHERPLGEGRVSVFTQDPFERAMWPGLHKLVLNAMLF